MAESDEHRFVSTSFIDLVHELSRSELYGYTEADRRRFDFACLLHRDHTRELVGQTLTHNVAGIEKDLSSLLFATAEIPVYLYAHSGRNQARIQEMLYHARQSIPDRVALARLYPYPVFDADDESDRMTVVQTLRQQVVEDLLLNVLFGRLSSVDIAFFLDSIGISGLLFATLESIATDSFFNVPDLARRLDPGLPPSTLRPRLTRLVTAGMLEVVEMASFYRISQRARAFLKLCSLIDHSRDVGVELAFVLGRLGLGDRRGPAVPFEDAEEALRAGRDPLGQRRRLAFEILAARERFGAVVSGGPYPLETRLTPPNARWITR